MAASRKFKWHLFKYLFSFFNILIAKYHLFSVEFEPEGSSDDDEETIAKEEALSAANKEAVSEEIDALKRESELPLEDLLSDYLSKRDKLDIQSNDSNDVIFIYLFLNLVWKYFHLTYIEINTLVN